MRQPTGNERSRLVSPATRPVEGRVRVPGSKSEAVRALVAAALSEGTSTVAGDLRADDVGVLVGGLKALGVAVETPAEGVRLRGLEPGGAFPAAGTRIDAGPAGAPARFLTALAALARGAVTIDGSARLRARPMGPLLDALAQLGSPARPLGRPGFLPVETAGGGLDGGACSVDGSASSQFLSALLLAATRARGDVRIEMTGRAVSRPYVVLTLHVAGAFGLRIERTGEREYRIRPRPGRARRYDVEPDASSAAFVFAAAAITGGEVVVEGLPRTSHQPDIAFLDLLEEMGCRSVDAEGGAGVRAGELRGIRADLTDTPDCLPPLAAVALFARGVTEIRGVPHARHKESDRLEALCRELGRLGASVEARADGLRIDPPGPSRLRGGTVDTAGDHRIAMALALAGLRIPGVRIDRPGCVSKSFPGFWDLW